MDMTPQSRHPGRGVKLAEDFKDSLISTKTGLLTTPAQRSSRAPPPLSAPPLPVPPPPGPGSRPPRPPTAMGNLTSLPWRSRLAPSCGRCQQPRHFVSFVIRRRGRQPIDIRLSVMAVTRRGLPIESITGAEALVESCGDGEPQKKKRATEQSISSSRGETLGSPVYER
ncbi:UNVERIFIED_CONTAM: hypothetical protein FKN15_064329 [Acipenser sinensis]